MGEEEGKRKRDGSKRERKTDIIYSQYSLCQRPSSQHSLLHHELVLLLLTMMTTTEPHRVRSTSLSYTLAAYGRGLL